LITGLILNTYEKEAPPKHGEASGDAAFQERKMLMQDMHAVGGSSGFGRLAPEEVECKEWK